MTTRPHPAPHTHAAPTQPKETMTHTAHPHRARRLIAVAALTLAGLLLGSAPAWAHLEVDPDTAEPGQMSTITFRVPNESPTASTTKVQIQIPASTPLATVRFRQTPGWTATAAATTLPTPVVQGNFTITKAVTAITFTAIAGNELAPGSYGDFSLTLGPLPDIKTLSFPSVQTYDNGDVVQWNQPTPASGEEPDNPMPTLTIAAAPAPKDTSSQTANSQAIAIAALVVAAAALLTAALSWRRRANAPTPPNGEPDGAEHPAPTTAGGQR